MSTQRQDAPKGYCLYKRKDSARLWVKLSYEGETYHESTGTADRYKADKYAQRRIAQLRTDTFDPAKARRTRVEELFEEVRTDYAVNRRKSLADLESRWNLHLKPFFGTMRANAVSTSILKRYQESRLEAGASHGSINRELAVLQRGFTLGRAAKLVHEVPVFPRLKESQAREGFIEDTQYRAIVNACPQLWFRGLIEMARTYGWRVAELQGLRVRQVDLAARTVRLDPGSTKNNEGRVIVMTDGAYVLLSECVRRKGPDDFVFTRADGKPVRDFRTTWHTACITAGLGRWVCPECVGHSTLEACRQQRTGQYRTRKGRTATFRRWVTLYRCAQCGKVWTAKQRHYAGAIFHDWRRTAARRLVRSGITEGVAMKITGHKTRSVFERYNITSEDDLKLAAAKLNQRDEAARHQAEGYVSGYVRPKPAAVAKLSRLN